MISLKFSIKFPTNKIVSRKLEWENYLYMIENVLKMIKAQDVIFFQHFAGFQLILGLLLMPLNEF